MGKYWLRTIASLISALALTPTCYAVTYQARAVALFGPTSIVTVPATSSFNAPFTMNASLGDTLSVLFQLGFVPTNLTSSTGTATVNVIGSGTSSITVANSTTVTRSTSASAILASMSGGTLTITNNGTITSSGGAIAIGSAVTGNVTVNISNSNSIVGNVNLSGGSGSVGGTITQIGSGTITGNLTFGRGTYQLNLFGSGNVTGAIDGNVLSTSSTIASFASTTLPGAITNMRNISVFFWDFNA